MAPPLTCHRMMEAGFVLWCGPFGLTTYSLRRVHMRSEPGSRSQCCMVLYSEKLDCCPTIRRVSDIISGFFSFLWRSLFFATTGPNWMCWNDLIVIFLPTCLSFRSQQASTSEVDPSSCARAIGRTATSMKWKNVKRRRTSYLVNDDKKLDPFSDSFMDNGFSLLRRASQAKKIKYK